MAANCGVKPCAKAVAAAGRNRLDPDRPKNRRETDMYTPAKFKDEDTSAAHALMRANPFAILVTHGPGGLMATHLPTVLKTDGADPLGRIECHLARPNPQWKSFAAEAEALMIFQGP